MMDLEQMHGLQPILGDQDVDEMTDQEEEAHRVKELHDLCRRLESNDPLLTKVETPDGECIELRNDKEAAMLASALQGNTHVEILALSLVGISLRGARHFENFLYYSPSLYCLYLDGSFADGDTLVVPEEVSIVHALMHAAMQNCNEMNLYLSYCPIAKSSLMGAVSSSSRLGQVGVTNCILVKDRDNCKHTSKNHRFSETLYGLSYAQDMTPSREIEMQGMMALATLMSQICACLPSIELRVDLGDEAYCGGFYWSNLISNATSLSSLHYRMSDHESFEAFQSVLSRADKLEELHLEMPSKFGFSKETILALIGAVSNSSHLTSVDLRIRRQDGPPIRCHIPQIEAHCTRNRQILEQYMDLKLLDTSSHGLLARTGFRSKHGRIAVSNRSMTSFMMRQC